MAEKTKKTKASKKAKAKHNVLGPVIRYWVRLHVHDPGALITLNVLNQSTGRVVTARLAFSDLNDSYRATVSLLGSGAAVRYEKNGKTGHVDLLTEARTLPYA